MITDTLHKEGRTQKGIAKEGGCCQSAVLISWKVEGKGKNAIEKGTQTTGITKGSNPELEKIHNEVFVYHQSVNPY